MNRYKIIRKVGYLVSTWFEGNKMFPPSNEPIDVVIPVIEKDLRVLPLCLEAVKRFVTNKIQTIYLVSPDNEKIKAFCLEHGLVFVDEATVLKCAGHVHYILSDGTNRSGWIFQQLLKLSATIGNCSHFLVIDADHILLRPHTFLTEEGKTVFYRSREYHAPYYEAIRKLMGWNKSPFLSYVAHKMLFSRETLEIMKKEIHIHTGKVWDQAILSILDPNELSCFSEYEIYGNYYPQSKAVNRLFRNKSLRYQQLASLDELVKKYSARYRAVTFPDYKNK